MQTQSPIQQYQLLVDKNEITNDPAQRRAVDELQCLHQSIIGSQKNSIKGLYLWGPVGRGKTFLMDLFVACLPSGLCQRRHFHHFMRDVHDQLKLLAGQENPLQKIAEGFRQRYQVLCFDEFFVSDIGDAMLLGNLLQYLFELNVVVVCTSNCEPNALYKNGLQRQRFLPAIAAINKFTQVLHLDGQSDHRHRTLTYVQNYYQLPNSETEKQALHQTLLSQFGLTECHHNQNTKQAQSITILGRQIHYIAQSDTNNSNTGLVNRSICFDFTELCIGPRSHFDYVEIAKRFDVIIVINIPPLSGRGYERIKARGTEDVTGLKKANVTAGKTGEREVVLAPMDDAARRFIALVDECYDVNLNLVLTGTVPKEAIYTSGTLLFEYERTKSRLVEMASLEYINRSRTT